MKVKIVDINFSIEYNWLFKFEDFQNNIYLIMEDYFYLQNYLRRPISKNNLDTYYFIGC